MSCTCGHARWDHNRGGKGACGALKCRCRSYLAPEPPPEPTADDAEPDDEVARLGCGCHRWVSADQALAVRADRPPLVWCRSHGPQTVAEIPE